MHKAIKRHENSNSHIVSTVSLAKFGKTNIELLLNIQKKVCIEIYNEKVKKNRDILKRLIDVVCYLGEQELAFRGHNETKESDNRGNFVELTNVIKKYDPILNTHLEQSSVFLGLSNRIQNDFIESVGEILLNKIKNEINDSPFVAIILESR